jgi:Carboxypeptidase regulatory-like domain
MSAYTAAFRLTIVLAVTAALGQPPAGQNFRISGTVVNALSGQPLSHTQVAIGPPQNGAEQAMTTAEDGRFVFENLRAGKYWLAAEHKGFARQALDEHESFSTAIAVGPNLISENLIFRLRPDAVISGTIFDEQNEPVRGAQVMLFRRAIDNGHQGIYLQAQEESDDLGRYRFSRLRPGTYFVVVSAQPWYAQHGRTVKNVNCEGCDAVTAAAPDQARSALDVVYAITYYPGATDANDAKPIMAKPGERVTADISLTPVPALNVRIKLAAALSQGVTVTQRVFDGDPINVPNESLVMGKGEITIGGLPPGHFVLAFTSAGKERSSREVEVDVSGDTDISESEGTRASAVTGVVKLDGSRVLSRRAYIQLRSRASGAAFGSRISAKGEFDLQNQPLPPGTYEVSVFTTQRAAVSTIEATGAKVTGHNIEIANAMPVRLIVTLSQGLGQIAGTALREGRPLAGGMILLVPEHPENNGSLFRRDQSDSDGTFSLPNVLPGKYTVVAIENGWDLEWSNADTLDRYIKNGTVVNVIANGKYKVAAVAQ